MKMQHCDLCGRDLVNWKGVVFVQYLTAEEGTSNPLADYNASICAKCKMELSNALISNHNFHLKAIK